MLSGTSTRIVPVALNEKNDIAVVLGDIGATNGVVELVFFHHSLPPGNAAAVFLALGGVRGNSDDITGSGGSGSRHCDCFGRL